MNLIRRMNETPIRTYRLSRPMYFPTSLAPQKQNSGITAFVLNGYVPKESALAVVAVCSRDRTTSRSCAVEKGYGISFN